MERLSMGTNRQQNVCAMVRLSVTQSAIFVPRFGVEDRTRLRNRTTAQTQTMQRNPYGLPLHRPPAFTK